MFSLSTLRFPACPLVFSELSMWAWQLRDIWSCIGWHSFIVIEKCLIEGDRINSHNWREVQLTRFCLGFQPEVILILRSFLCVSAGVLEPVLTPDFYVPPLGTRQPTDSSLTHPSTPQTLITFSLPISLLFPVPNIKTMFLYDYQIDLNQWQLLESCQRHRSPGYFLLSESEEAKMKVAVVMKVSLSKLSNVFAEDYPKN